MHADHISIADAEVTLTYNAKKKGLRLIVMEANGCMTISQERKYLTSSHYT
jgi:hypothetical protein